MKKLISLLALALVSVCAMADNYANGIPAFPGAEGNGRYGVAGGRGGYVYHVTNLSDDADSIGSLRWALAQTGPRTIVFDVSGYIDLEAQLNIPAYTTIAGQTAPGDGITLRYYTLYLNGNDIIVRFIRVRRSEVMEVDDGADATWGRKHNRVIFDHCSFSWGIDECASFYDNAWFTMQWCTLGEGLANAGHGKGEHSYGGIWGGKEATFTHNMLIHFQNRTPRVNGARYWWTGHLTAIRDTLEDGTKQARYSDPVDAERVDLRNNLYYNWGTGNGAYGGPGGGYINVVNNYYKAGPGTKATTRVMQISALSSSNGDSSIIGTYLPTGYYARWYIDGNYVTAASSPSYYDWNGVTVDSSTLRFMIDGEYYFDDSEYGYYQMGDTVPLKLDEPVITGDVTTHSAETAYEKVMAYAGACLYRDAVDTRYMEECANGTTTYTGSNGSTTAGIIDVVADCGGFPDLTSESRADDFDTDGDGMPDEWETANGLDPNDDSDGNLYTLDTEKGWYTNLEVYLNSLVEDIMRAGMEDAESSFDEYFPLTGTLEGTNTGIGSVINYASNAPVSTTYYTLDGRQTNLDGQQGIFIRVETLADGSKVTTKVLKK